GSPGLPSAGPSSPNGRATAGYGGVRRRHMTERVNVHDLLTSADWLRQLARHVVHGDQGLADDVVQETWLAAVKSPPTAGRPPRPWLAQVLRNLVRKDVRSSRNRAGREAAVREASEIAASAEDLLQRAETHRLLAELVTNL